MAATVLTIFGPRPLLVRAVATCDAPSVEVQLAARPSTIVGIRETALLGLVALILTAVVVVGFMSKL